MTYSTWSQITLPNWSTAKYLLRCDLKMTVSPSFEGSRIQTCFFFNAFPLALILNPKVSALKYLYWLELEEKVGYYNSSFLFPFFQKCLQGLLNRHHSRFFDCLAHPNLSATLATDQKWPLSHLRISYQSLAECH